MTWEKQKKKIGDAHRELLKKSESKQGSGHSKPAGVSNPFALVTHIGNKPIERKSSDSIGSRDSSHAGKHDGRLGEMNTGSSSAEVYSHQRTPHAQKESSVFDLVTHIDGKPIK
jgi:hypothetical protein